MAKEQEAAAAAAPGAPRRRQPRLCHMLKGPDGYGFHLHGEKGKSGQFIRKVEPDSPAEEAGLRAGDRVVEVNGVNVEKETHHQVVQRIKVVEAETSLLVVDKETDDYLRSLQLTCTKEMVSAGIVADLEALPAKSPSSDNGDIWKPQMELSGRNLKRHKHSLSLESAKKDVNGQAKEPLCPRLCHLQKGPTGYGFNLHSEKSRPGQFIRSVDPDSPASKAGLRPQDRLIEVTGWREGWAASGQALCKDIIGTLCVGSPVPGQPPSWPGTSGATRPWLPAPVRSLSLPPPKTRLQLKPQLGRVVVPSHQGLPAYRTSLLLLSCSGQVHC
ncbi:Na(+)/H(+) exchange regulatory cofactor NHE-RF2 [Varanus komodoensis]|nr:Na(+)/H(+) exchange regulatory cofactor NHE-RF2 [Varanus komodoensis]